MSRERHFYQPKDGHRLAHDPFNSIVAPRPIGWVSTKSSNGQVNLAPYSFFNAFNYQPPIIGFSSIGFKDSVKNAQESGEFCWNLVSRSHAEAMNQTSAAVSSDIDEFELAGLSKRADYTNATSLLICLYNVGKDLKPYRWLTSLRYHHY